MNARRVVIDMAFRRRRAGAGGLLAALEAYVQALEEAIARPWLEPRTGLTTIAEPYLVLLKLRVGRTTDIADLSRMLGAASDETLSAVRSAVERHGGPENADDLESLIALGRLERGQEASNS